MKMRIAFAAIALFAIASAFTTAHRTSLNDVFGRDENSGLVFQVDPAQEGTTFICDQGSKFCTYQNYDAVHDVLSNPIQTTQSYKFIKL